MGKKLTVNVSAVLDKRNKKKDGTYPLKLCVYYERTNKKYGLKISLTAEEWDKINSKQLKQETLLEIRKTIGEEVGKVTNIIQKLGDEFTIEIFESIYLNKPVNKSSYSEKDIIYSLFADYIQSLKQEERIGNATACETAMKSLKQFSPSLPIKKLTPQFLESYEKWMLDNKKSLTTVGIYLRSLRTIVNIAKDDGYFTDKTYPFGQKAKKKYEIPIGKNIKKALPADDLKKIINAEMPHKEAEYARDLWLFSLYCNGMNMADIFNLKYESILDDFIYFKRAKTRRTKKNQSDIAIFITEPVAQIIKKWGNKDKSPENYIFNILNESMTASEKYIARQNHTRSVNGYMKRLVKRLGIKTKISTYFARHSWATLLKNNGVSIAEISEGLGHSSLETTKNYLDSFPQEHKKQTAINFKNMLITND